MLIKEISANIQYSSYDDYKPRNFQSEWDSILQSIFRNVLRRHFTFCRMILLRKKKNKICI